MHDDIFRSITRLKTVLLHSIDIEEVPVDIRLRMRFMHDGAPPHSSRVAGQYLNQHFANK